MDEARGAAWGDASASGYQATEAFSVLDLWPDRIEPEPMSGCWIWVGARIGGEYARIYVNGVGYPVHRISYELANGPIPNGLFALHRCDLPPCVNPAHLFVGTKRQNSRDMVQKGRQRGGFVVKLNAEQVQEILASQAPASLLASRFGVCRAHINKIRRGGSWRTLASVAGIAELTSLGRRRAAAAGPVRGRLGAA